MIEGSCLGIFKTAKANNRRVKKVQCIRTVDITAILDGSLVLGPFAFLLVASKQVLYDDASFAFHFKLHLLRSKSL